MNQLANRNGGTVSVPDRRPGLCGIGALCFVLLASGRAPAADKLEYNRDIRPILSENCFRCHGPDTAARKAELRLDRREIAIEKGAIAPGDLESSELVARITSDDRDEIMPPPKSQKKLTNAQKDLLKRWIASGAEYQEHWSFIAPVRPQPPAVRDASWARTPLDLFVLAKLEQHGLQPAPEADRRTLARRVALDLTGLPPAPADVAAFVNDPSPSAYEKLVDSLLASPKWGEHRGRYWLDAARYADTNGIHFDNYREIWSYRDWVISAFNRNTPFDQFTLEQLAGDLLPKHTLEQQIASGFNRCNITTNEGGSIAEEILVSYTRDRTETVSQVWLGLTAGCAVCHDHKFDPFSQKEFYELAAFFNNTRQAAFDLNIKDTAPTIFVPLPDDRDRWSALDPELVSARAAGDARKYASRAEFDRWLAEVKPEAFSPTIPNDGLKLHALLNDREAASPSPTQGQTALLEVADAGDYEKDQAFAYAAWVKILKTDQTGSVVARLDDEHDQRGWDLRLESGRIAANLIHKWPEDAIKVVTRTEVKPGEWTHLLVTYDGSARADGVKIYFNGKAQATQTRVDRLTQTIRTAVSLTVGQRHSKGRLSSALVRDLRLYGRTLKAEEVAQLAAGTLAIDLVAKPVEHRTAAEVRALLDWWLSTLDESGRSLLGRVASLEQEQAAIKARGTFAHVMSERSEEPIAYILYRGEYDKRRDQVKAGTPAVLPPLPPDAPRNRLGFAQWLLRPEHPLTARVTVNRFWQEVFGAGLVRTTGDFGITGEPPSHPELLNWLAVEFRESGWDMKRFFKMMVTSATYMQSAVFTREKLEGDPQNRLLSRGPRFRMDAEMVRDNALAASGLLVPKIGGPSVKPYQPDGVWEAVAMPESNTHDYKRDHGASLYRRSLYTFWKRAAPPASMDIFNATTRETCTVRRERTNTPLQALVTLNDPQFVEAARNLAQLALKQGGDTAEARLQFIAERLLARPLRLEEERLARGSLDDLLTYYQAHADDAAKLLSVGESKAEASLNTSTLAAWTMLANELMNLDEVLNK